MGASQSDRSINLYLDNKVSGVVSNQRTGKMYSNKTPLPSCQNICLPKCVLANLLFSAGILGLLASKRKQVRVGTAAPVVRNAAKAKPVRGTGTTQKKAKKAHTLFSAGILHTARKKNNEYFGGDSTVVSAGEEEDEEDAEQ